MVETRLQLVGVAAHFPGFLADVLEPPLPQLLGLGRDAPHAGVGAMVSAGKELLAQRWVATFPGLAIFLTVIALNFAGDGVRDALDPKARARA